MALMAQERNVQTNLSFVSNNKTCGKDLPWALLATYQPMFKETFTYHEKVYVPLTERQFTPVGYRLRDGALRRLAPSWEFTTDSAEHFSDHFNSGINNKDIQTHLDKAALDFDKAITIATTAKANEKHITLLALADQLWATVTGRCETEKYCREFFRHLVPSKIGREKPCKNDAKIQSGTTMLSLRFPATQVWRSSVPQFVMWFLPYTGSHHHDHGRECGGSAITMPAGESTWPTALWQPNKIHWPGILASRSAFCRN